MTLASAKAVSSDGYAIPGKRAEDDFSGRVSLKNLSAEEVGIVQRFLIGDCFMRVNAGRIEAHSIHAPLPEPEDDPAVGEPWQHSELQPIKFGRTSYGPAPAWGGGCIIIQHLCGYGYTPERYAANVKKLKSYGFACMRSKRGGDGRFWEIWFLPGLWMADGDLKASLEGERVICLSCRSAQHLHDSVATGETECWHCIRSRIGKLPKPNSDTERQERAFDFLVREVSFGTMDAAHQRAAMVID